MKPARSQLPHVAWACLAFGLLTVAGEGLAAEGTLHSVLPTPAVWLEGKEAFSSKLQCPTTDALEDSVVSIYCQAEVTAAGEIINSGCLPPPGPHTLQRKAARRALMELEYVPATVDGVPVAVLIYATAIFVTKGGTCTAIGYPNWGVNLKALGGLDYTAPQEILTNGGWVKTIPRIMRQIRRQTANKLGLVLAMSAEVSANGVPSEVRLVKNNIELEKHDIEKVTGAYLETRFVPAYFNGQPKATRIMEAFHIVWWAD